MKWGSCYGKAAPCSRNKYVTRDLVSEASCDEDVREDAAGYRDSYFALLANLFSVYASLFLSRCCNSNGQIILISSLIRLILPCMKLRLEIGRECSWCM